MAFRKADRDVFAEMARRLHGASFDVKRFCGGHAPQLAFMQSRHQWSHVMCARQSGKTWSCDGLLAENAISRRGSTNLFLGLKGTGVRISNWVPVWRREICGFAGIPESWHNDTQMLTTFPGGSRVMFAGTDDLSNIKKYLGNRLDNGTVIIDECFPAGTMVSGKAIESIAPGDVIACVDHASGSVRNGTVARTMSKVANAGLVTLVLLNGDRVSCTPNHPVFVKGKGYLHAKDLRNGDLLCVLRPSNRDARNVLSVVPVGASSEDFDGEQLAHTRGERSVVRIAEGGQSDVQFALPCADEEDVESDRSQAACQGRQWDADAVARGSFAEPVGRGLGIGAGDTDADQEGPRVSDLLQGRPWQSFPDDVYRGRWSEPRDLEVASGGQEEVDLLGWCGLAADPVHEQGSVGCIVYNLEIEGAHTYFANGVLVHNCQDQPREVLRYIIRQLLPPMMTPTTRIVLAGVLPDVPAGLFFELAHPAPLDGGMCDCKGFHHFEWGRAANVHTPEAMEQLASYMRDHYLKVDDPQIQRDWYMKRVWDAMATAYRYRQAINGYVAIAPEWLDRYDWEHGTAFAAIPHPGITNFTFGIDPGGGDRTSITGWGWGEHTHEIQHVFEWCTPRDTHVPLSEIASTLGIAVQHYPTSDIYWDPGSGSLEIDTFGTDYGIPLVRAANKSDFPGQVRRVNDLLTKAWLQVMIGSALEEDYTRARFDQTARAAGQWKWSSQWHPDPSESGRYGLAGYWASYTEPEVPKSHEEQRREAVKKKQVRAQARAAGQSLPQEIEEKLFEGDEEFIDLESLLG